MIYKPIHGTSLINNAIDLTSQRLILKAAPNNPLVKVELYPETGKDEVTAIIKLKKVLTADSLQNSLTYTNMSEIVEIENEIGRYNNDAIPGNQKLNLQPQEFDTSGASESTLFDNNGNIDDEHPQDGTINIIPPTGTRYVYYILSISMIIIFVVGVYLIKKFVI